MNKEIEKLNLLLVKATRDLWYTEKQYDFALEQRCTVNNRDAIASSRADTNFYNCEREWLEALQKFREINTKIDELEVKANECLAL